MAGNQTQWDVEGSAMLACHDWITSGPRTLERLNHLADSRAFAKSLPRGIVRSTALNILRERVPDILPHEMQSENGFPRP